MNRRLVPSAVALFLLGSAVSGVGQLPPAPPSNSQDTFRSGVDLVRLDVSVLDEQGMPVRGLTASDFTVLEGGKELPIAAFSAIDLPDRSSLQASWTREVAPDVVSNRFVAQRTIVIVLDDFNIPVDPWTVRTTKQIAGDVIDAMDPKDLGAVVYTFNRRKGQEFTADRTRLLAGVDRFTAIGKFLPLSAQLPNPNAASERGPRSGPPPAWSSGGGSGACQPDCVTSALQNAAEILHGSPEGRKTLVLISPQGRGAPTGDVDDRTARMVVAMQEANINLYQFDPRGLQTSPQSARGLFESFAEMTGGRSITDTNAPWRLVPQVFRENSSYYLLGVQPTVSRTDGRFHRLTVRVARPDVEVRTRSGYVAPLKPKKGPAKPLSPLDAAIARGLPTGDVPIELALAPFASPGKPGGTLMIVAGIEPPAEFAAGARIEMIATAFRDDWKSAGARTQQITLPRSVPGSDSLHLDLRSQLDLPPGRYEIRVAIDSRTTSRTGSVYGSVIVPDFVKEALSLSGVVIERGDSRTAVAPSSANVLGATASTTTREFGRFDNASSLFRIYQGGKKPLVPVRLTVRVVDSDDHTAFIESWMLGPERFKDRSADARVNLPLKALEPGHYLLVVNAEGGPQPVIRNVRFTVR